MAECKYLSGNAFYIPQGILRSSNVSFSAMTLFINNCPKSAKQIVNPLNQEQKRE